MNDVGVDMQMLLRNRTILHELLDQRAEKKIKVKRAILHKMGYKFELYTGSYTNRQQKTYYYIFDYSWMAFSDQEILILKRDTK